MVCGAELPRVFGTTQVQIIMNNAALAVGQTNLGMKRTKLY